MLYFVHSCPIYRSQKAERTQMCINRGMDTENVVHLHNGVNAAIKNNEFIKFLGKWVYLEDIILSEVTQSQKTHI
jgi:sulfur transfer complex TusBCD TusB component (DsrH family)